MKQQIAQQIHERQNSECRFWMILFFIFVVIAGLVIFVDLFLTFPYIEYAGKMSKIAQKGYQDAGNRMEYSASIGTKPELRINIGGGTAQQLESEISSYQSQGLSRTEAIQKIAERSVREQGIKVIPKTPEEVRATFTKPTPTCNQNKEVVGIDTGKQSVAISEQLKPIYNQQNKFVGFEDNLQQEDEMLKERLNITQDNIIPQPNIFGNYVLKYECWLSGLNSKLESRRAFKTYEIYEIALKQIKSDRNCEVFE